MSLTSHAVRPLLAASLAVAASTTPRAQTAPLTTTDTRTQAIDVIKAKWTGDWDGIRTRRVIRILTPYSRTDYFIDRGIPRGIVYDAGIQLEKEINRTLKTGPTNHVHVVFVPTARDALYSALVGGIGDIVAAAIPVTPQRSALVDFTTPIKTDVRQILVTGPGAPAIANRDDLSGKIVAAREYSVHLDSLRTLNAEFKAAGRPPVDIKVLPVALEDEDVLEMVHAGLIKAAVIDDFGAEFWGQILPGLRLRPDVVLQDGGELAWAVRKNSPRFLAALNPLIRTHRPGTLWGNVMLQRYLKNTQFVTAATGGTERERFQSLVGAFQKYSRAYRLDYLLMMAQGYQESRLDQRRRSPVGAIGVMQVMPATAADLKVGDIHQVDANVHAGVKYIRLIIDEHFSGEPIPDFAKTLFAFAAYNCGPTRLRQLRQEAAARGLNPNVWFGNVEQVVAERVGRETVTYVSNIYKYYLAYSLTPDWVETPGSPRTGAVSR